MRFRCRSPEHKSYCCYRARDFLIYSVCNQDILIGFSEITNQIPVNTTHKDPEFEHKTRAQRTERSLIVVEWFFGSLHIMQPNNALNQFAGTNIRISKNPHWKINGRNAAHWNYRWEMTCKWTTLVPLRHCALYVWYRNVPMSEQYNVILIDLRLE